VPKHILIVDDSAAVRRALRDVLEQQQGWEVSGEAGNGREAIEEVQKAKPDVIVLDLSMPVMNGLETTRELKCRFPSVPVLMYTDFETQYLQQAARSAGVSSIVSKSESTEVLVRNLHALMDLAA